MISCEHARNLFDAYLNDELSSAMSAELDAHLLDCSSCRHQMSLLEACGNVIRLDINEPKTSGDFTDRIMAILEEQPATRSSLQLNRALKFAGGLVGIAAAIALVVFLYPRHPDIEVAPGKYVPQQALPVEITTDYFGFPIFEALDRSAAIFSAGQQGLNRLSLPANEQDQAPVRDGRELAPMPAPQSDLPSELDVLQTLPDTQEESETL